MSRPADRTAATGKDPLAILRGSTMSWVQVRAVCAVLMVNTADGFDIFAIAFAIPGIAREWGASPVGLGAAISAGLAGMAIGSLTLGATADRYGRRPVMLGATLAIAAGMLLTAFAANVVWLCAMRFLTGLAIGALLSPMVIATEEFASERRKNLCLGLISVGVPIGGALGGAAAMVLLDLFGWRSIFVAGAALTLFGAVCIFLFLPETIPFLIARRPAGFEQKITRLMARMGHAEIEIPAVGENVRSRAPRGKLDRVFYKHTTLLCLLFCGHALTFYYLVGWMPKMVRDLGFSESEAASVSAIFNLASVVGLLLLGLVKGRLGLIRTLVAIYVGSVLMVCVFGALPGNLLLLQLVGGLCGFAAQPGIIATYALTIGSYETELRSTGLGFVIGLGRAASALAPLLAGALFAAGDSRFEVSAIFAGGSALAAILLIAFAGMLGRFLDQQRSRPA